MLEISAHNIWCFEVILLSDGISVSVIHSTNSFESLKV